MNKHNQQPKDNVGLTIKWVIVGFILIGLLLISISVSIPEEGSWIYWKDLVKELGIVVLSVFAISFIYERTVADKYLNYFLARLRLQVQEGESNAATCALLGILRIFPTRDSFEAIYPLPQLVAGLTTKSQFRVVARSAFLLMTKAESIQKAIAQGAQVELCIVDPNTPPEQLINGLDVEVGDILSALSTFRKQIAGWIATAKPPGKVRVRLHQIPNIDSFASISSSTQRFVVWDLSFGRAITAKRIFLLDSEKPLGIDLAQRYDRIWETSKEVFEYDGKSIILDDLSSPSGKVPNTA